MIIREVETLDDPAPFTLGGKIGFYDGRKIVDVRLVVPARIAEAIRGGHFGEGTKTALEVGHIIVAGKLSGG